MCLCSSSIEEEGPFPQFYLLNVHPRKQVTLVCREVPWSLRWGSALVTCTDGHAEQLKHRVASLSGLSLDGQVVLVPTRLHDSLPLFRAVLYLLPISSFTLRSLAQPVPLLAPPCVFVLLRSLSCWTAATKPSLTFFRTVIYPKGWLFSFCLFAD